MDNQKILRIVEREIWFFNKSMWAIFTVVLFLQVSVLGYMGATLNMDTLMSFQVGLGLGVLAVLGIIANKFPPKSVQKRR